MFDEAVYCHFQSVPEATVTVEALRALGRMLQAASDVLQAQHESTTRGEPYTQTEGYNNEATHAVSSQDSGRSTTGDRREGGCSSSPASSSAHGSKGRGEQTSGVRS